MTSIWNSSALLGVQAHPVQVEADLMYQLPSFHVVGLPGVMVRESRDRVRSAIRNSGYDFPVRKVVINLIPANLKKDRLALDLPMALSVLEESGQVPRNLGRKIWALGELSLQGELRGSFGLLPALLAAQKNNAKAFIGPPMAEGFHQFCHEVLPDLPVYSFKSLGSVVEFLRSQSGAASKIKPRSCKIENSTNQRIVQLTQHSKAFKRAKKLESNYELGHLFGLDEEKKILSVALATRMHVLVRGPRGVGKSALIKGLRALQPPLKREEIVECASIRSLIEPSFEQDYKRTNEEVFSNRRPFRTPHSQATAKSFFGGGQNICPGELTLAHKGILFMDEISEFSRSIREGLRQPLDDRFIYINRADYRIGLPADFQLMATSNLCPCGAWGSTSKTCLCGEGQIIKYRSRLSEALSDRIQIHLRLCETPEKEKSSKFTSRSPRDSKWVVRQVQRIQFFEKEIEHRPLSEILAKHEKYFRLIKERFQISYRSLKNIADLARALSYFDESDSIEDKHLEEASFWALHTHKKDFFQT